MTDLFEKCIEIILRNEGGYVNNPDDPGGETNYGIAKKFYPYLDIKNLTKKQAIEIFHRDYWKPMRLSKIEDENLVLQVFDMGINAGTQVAIRLLQRLVNVSDDGIIGKITLDAIKSYSGNLLEEYIKRRKLFYVTLVQNKPKLRVFIKGWLRRIENTHF
jgi:lysozyme family protein